MRTFCLIFLLFVFYGCESQNDSIKNDNYLKISMWIGLDGDQKLSNIKYFKDGNIVKEIHYSSNGLQILDSTCFIYKSNQLVRKIEYKVEFDKVTIDSIDVINSSNSQFIIEINKSNGDLSLSYFAKNGDLIRKSSVSENLFSNSEYNDSTIHFVSSYKDYLGIWNTNSGIQKWYPNLFIDSVFNKDIYQLYEKKYQNIFHDCEYKISKTVSGDIIQNVKLTENSVYPFYGISTLPMLDSISVVFNKYRISKVFVHFINGDTYNEVYLYSNIGQLIRIESWNGDKKENVFITSFKYESISEVE